MGRCVWSGECVSSFECFNRQVRAGLSMAIAEFHGGRLILEDCRGDDPEFRETFLRWFAYGCFSPVIHLQAMENPQLGRLLVQVVPMKSGVLERKFFKSVKNILRFSGAYALHIREQISLADEKGTPVMVSIFYDYPEDKKAWEVEDSYLFGTDYPGPVLEAGSVFAKRRSMD